jgi:hypothetical protein
MQMTTVAEIAATIEIDPVKVGYVVQLLSTRGLIVPQRQGRNADGSLKPVGYPTLAHHLTLRAAAHNKLSTQDVMDAKKAKAQKAALEAKYAENTAVLKGIFAAHSDTLKAIEGAIIGGRLKAEEASSLAAKLAHYELIDKIRKQFKEPLIKEIYAEYKMWCAAKKEVA